ncbi:beta-arrestin-2-like isoform X2 [Dysidea avara]|uniref:beta-arrestin-2-like isoform X2 n=1 Tax=Dysidea avara TaxID=196820 RepID=UPI00332A0EC6
MAFLSRVFKKSSPNGKVTVYLGKRDFVDHVTEQEPIDGVVLVDPEYFEKEGKQDRKVYAQLLCGFRYGREDLEVFGLNFRRDLVDERMQVFPPTEELKPQLMTLLQIRLMKKLGDNAYPFIFVLKPGLPSSITLQPGANDVDKPCGIDFFLRVFVGKHPSDKIEKRNSVRLAIKKITHAPVTRTNRPSLEVKKDFLLSSRPLQVEANLDKGTYYHGEPIRVNVSIRNGSSKTIKKIRITVRQLAYLCLFAQSEYKCDVASLESEEGFPLHQGGSMQRTYDITPLLADNRSKRGLALDGQIKHEDTCLASSSIFPQGDDENKEVRERAGIIVHYNVKIRCIVSFGSDLTMELPFTLTHPEPEHKVICGMVTLPRRKSTIKSVDQQPVDDPADSTVGATGGATAMSVSAMEDKPFDTSSIHGVVDHNLITFDTGGGDDDTDFVFEEFVRLRIAGAVDENAETDA